MSITIDKIVGGSGPILNILIKDPSFLETTSATIAMNIAKNIAERRFKKKLEETMLAELQAVYDTYVADNGELENSERKGDWEEGMDDAVAALFEPYQTVLTNDFLVDATVDTRLHEENMIANLAVRFASTVWQVLTYYEGKSTTAKILSAIGIVKSDIEELMGDRLVAEDESTQPTTPEKETVMPGSLNETLKKLYLVCGSDFNVGEYMDAFDLATDNDDILAQGAIARLGGDEGDVATLREFRRKHGASAPAMLCDLLLNAENLPDEEPTVPAEEHVDAASEETEEQREARELAELMGETPPEPTAPGVQAGVPLDDPLDIPPALDRRTKKPAATPKPPPVKAGEGAWGFQVPKEALELIKAHTPDKDQDLGEGVGVSRATYNNYTLGKATLIADEAQLAYLRSVCQGHIEGLTKALELLQA